METPDTNSDQLEKEKYEDEKRFKKAELDLKREELKSRRETERKGLLLSSPLFVTFLSAALGLIGIGVGSALQGYWNTELERQKYESTLIQKAVDAPEKAQRAENLQFLVAAGLIKSLDKQKIAYLASISQNPFLTQSANTEVLEWRLISNLREEFKSTKNARAMKRALDKLQVPVPAGATVEDIFNILQDEIASARFKDDGKYREAILEALLFSKN